MSGAESVSRLTPPQGGNISWAGVPIQQHTCDSNLKAQYYTLKPPGYVISNDGRAPWYCPWCIEIGDEGFFIMDRGPGLCLDARDGAKNDGLLSLKFSEPRRHAR